MPGGVREPHHENGSTEQCTAVCHLFLCVKFCNSATTTHGKLQQTFGDDAVARTHTFLWYNMFSEARNLVKDKLVTTQQG
jgi:hypothetical protein